MTLSLPLGGTLTPGTVFHEWQLNSPAAVKIKVGVHSQKREELVEDNVFPCERFVHVSYGSNPTLGVKRSLISKLCVLLPFCDWCLILNICNTPKIHTPQYRDGG